MEQAQPFYPGNRDLPVEVRDRVLTTFRQAVELHKTGRLDEVVAGCDLILKMDPQFSPAKKLLEKAQNPSGPSAAPGVGSRTADALSAAREALKNRDFGRAVELSNEILRSDLTNEQAQDISREGQEKMEAVPFAEQFLDKAQTQLLAGNLTGASTELEKARSLDAHHPRIGKMDSDLSAERAKNSPTNKAPVSPPTSPAPAAAAPAAFDFKPSNEPPLTFDFDTVQTQSNAPASSSFIVDTPAAAPGGRSAQASDFGFSFAEDDSTTGGEAPKPAAAPGPVQFDQGSFGEAQTFDFTSAVVDTTPEDQARIEAYLREGDEAFAAGQYRAATDTWSRIFLIDVTNHPASERIENARRKQIDVDTRIEDALNSGTVAYERKDLAVARAHFEEVISLDRDHPIAKEYMSRLPSVLPAPALSPAVSTTDPVDHPGFGDDMFAEEFAPSAETVYPPDVPPSRTTRTAPEKALPPIATPKSRAMPMLLLAGALAVLGGAGYFGYKALRGGEQTPDATQSLLLIRRAQALGRTGKYNEAIELLSTVSAADPQHDQAVNLIADYRNKRSSRPALIDGRPAAEVYNELLTNGRVAHEAKDYLGARESFQRAAAIRALPDESAKLLASAAAQVAKLEGAIALIKQGNPAGALQNLENLDKQDPGNPNIQKLINDAHFNLGAVAMREGRLPEAITEFDKVLQVTEDAVARRSKEIAQKYTTEEKDLLFQIYVKHLPLR